eukprot:TRINITY_DN1058_c0_g1_i1.p1 TRINITY_DN1058_c0_g1~~TRINITY_DN1058_c0_g1_i1.p1  ORF type:complete len:142 (-),score=26.05 TRINITY_DN1058_c0_g1_i1:146-571(-)
MTIRGCWCVIFGLSRRVFSTDRHQSSAQYVASAGAELPWKWSAIETLTKSTSTKQSGIWMLGITIVELFLVPDEPFGDTPNSLIHIANISRDDFELEIVKGCPDILCYIACECCKRDPAVRPTANKIISDLQKAYHKRIQW